MSDFVALLGTKGGPAIRKGSPMPTSSVLSLGGQVVVDFAPMPKRDRSILDQVLKAAFKGDGEVNLAGWTTLGLFELTRKRDRLPLAEVLGEQA